MADAKAQLDGFIGKFTPEIGRSTRAVLRKMRAILPGAVELVYDNYNALAIGFGSGEKMKDIMFSIAVYPRWVSLFFAGGVKLKDPHKLLKGTGTKVRHIVLAGGAADLDKAEIRALMDQVVAKSDPIAGKRRLIIKAISAKQRPRRPQI